MEIAIKHVSVISKFILKVSLALVGAMCLTGCASTVLEKASYSSDDPDVVCKPKYSQIYQPPLKLGGAGRVIQVPSGENCAINSKENVQSSESIYSNDDGYKALGQFVREAELKCQDIGYADGNCVSLDARFSNAGISFLKAELQQGSIDAIYVEKTLDIFDKYVSENSDIYKLYYNDKVSRFYSERKKCLGMSDKTDLQRLCHPNAPSHYSDKIQHTIKLLISLSKSYMSLRKRRIENGLIIRG